MKSNASGQFNCCGYLDKSPKFVQDSTCPSAEAAGQKFGCVGPFSNYANEFLDLIFTSMFGFVGKAPLHPFSLVVFAASPSRQGMKRLAAC